MPLYYLKSQMRIVSQSLEFWPNCGDTLHRVTNLNVYYFQMIQFDAVNSMQLMTSIKFLFGIIIWAARSWEIPPTKLLVSAFTMLNIYVSREIDTICGMQLKKKTSLKLPNSFSWICFNDGRGSSNHLKHAAI